MVPQVHSSLLGLLLLLPLLAPVAPTDANKLEWERSEDKVGQAGEPGDILLQQTITLRAAPTHTGGKKSLRVGDGKSVAGEAQVEDVPVRVGRKGLWTPVSWLPSIGTALPGRSLTWLADGVDQLVSRDLDIDYTVPGHSLVASSRRSGVFAQDAVTRFYCCKCDELRAARASVQRAPSTHYETTTKVKIDGKLTKLH